MADALVIAASSFVGRHLVEELKKRRLRVLASARDPGDSQIRCDLNDTESVRQVLKAADRPRWIFQCAGGFARQAAEPVWNLHVDCTRRVLAAVREWSPDSTIVLFGSASEYGPIGANELPLTEETPCRPVSAYSQSKLAQTHLAQSFAKEWGLRVAIVRPFNILGRGLAPTYLTSNLIRELRELLARGASGTFPVHNGSVTRDWIDVRDVVHGLLAVCELAPPHPGVSGLWNLASERELRVLDLAEGLCRLAGGFVATDAGNQPGYADVPRSVGSSAKLRAATGWSPKYSLEESLAWMWEAANSPVGQRPS